MGAGVPALYRQYVEVAEPGGTRFMAFGVDAGFGHCIDGLVVVDLHRLKPEKRARYLGSAAWPGDGRAEDKQAASTHTMAPGPVAGSGRIGVE